MFRHIMYRLDTVLAMWPHARQNFFMHLDKFLITDSSVVGVPTNQLDNIRIDVDDESDMYVNKQWLRSTKPDQFRQTLSHQPPSLAR